MRFQEMLAALDAGRVQEVQAALATAVEASSEDRALSTALRHWLAPDRVGAAAAISEFERRQPSGDAADGGDLRSCVFHALTAEDALRVGRMDDLAAGALAAARAVPPGGPWLRFRVGSLMQAAYRFTGDPDLAERTIRLLSAPADHVSNPSMASAARGLMGNVYMLQGRYHAAMECFDAALALAETRGAEGDPATAMAHQFRGYVLFEWNHLDAARRHLELAWKLSGEGASRGVGTGVARVLALVAAAEGKEPEARAWTDRLERLIGGDSSLRNREWLAAVRARGLLRAGDRRGAHEWLRTHGYGAARIEGMEDRDVHARLQELTTVLDFAVATEQWRDALRVGSRIFSATAGGRRWFAARAAVSLAVATERLGRPAEAEEHLTAAFAEAEEGSLLRVFVAAPETVMPVLDRIRPGADAQHLERVAAVLTMVAEGRPRPGLTAREVEVVALVARGLSNKAIGQHLGISLGTVKTHVHHVLEKLGAASRTEAASRARALGLI